MIATGAPRSSRCKAWLLDATNSVPSLIGRQNLALSAASMDKFGFNLVQRQVALLAAISPNPWG
jgi:hypothetical protein